MGTQADVGIVSPLLTEGRDMITRRLDAMDEILYDLDTRLSAVERALSEVEVGLNMLENHLPDVDDLPFM